jgi:hypothetical protein
LTHRYSFNGNAQDSVGGMHGEKLGGGATYNNGRVVFNPAFGEGYIRLQPNIILAGSTDITLEFWASTGTHAFNKYPVLCQIGMSSTLNQNSIIIDRNGYYGNIDAYIYTTPVAVVAGRVFDSQPETHIVYTVSRANNMNTLTLYQNGILMSSIVTAALLPANYGAGGFLGKSFYAADPPMSGSINEFRVYNSALTLTQVLANFQNGPDAIL